MYGLKRKANFTDWAASNPTIFSTFKLRKMATATKTGGGGSGSLTALKRRRYNPFQYTNAYRKNRNFYQLKGAPVERKFVDSHQVPVVWGAYNSTSCINQIPQEVDSSSRIGKRATCISIQTRIKAVRGVKGASDPTPVNSTVRIIIVVMKVPTPTAPTVGDILQNFTSPSIALVSPINLSNSQNFIILKDVVFELDGGHGEEFYWQFFHKCRINVEYLSNNANGSYTGQIKGGIWMLMVTNKTGFEEPTVNVYSRVRFIDL